MKIRALQAIVFAAAMVCFAAAGHAQTRQPTAQETKLIWDCVAKYYQREEANTECLFKLVADPCIEKNGSNLGTADCYRIEAAIWDKLLNENYKTLMDMLDDPNDQDKLKEMQRAWIPYRDTTCDFYWYRIHGSMSVPMTAACQLREAANRAILLGDLQKL